MLHVASVASGAHVDLRYLRLYTRRRNSVSSVKSPRNGSREVVTVDYRVPSVALAMRVLKLLSRDKYKRSTLTELAVKLDASPTTCLRVLRTLEQEHFVCLDPETKRYSLGPYLITIGNRAAQTNDIVARATSAIRRIASLTGLTTALLQRWDDRLIFLAVAEPPTEDARFTRLSIPVGQPTYLTAGAHGRCFLAYEDEDEWRRLLALGLRPLTPDTILDPQEFIEALRKVRRTGYAVSHGEFYAGTSAVDAPIFGSTGRVELVISCMYVSSQMERDRVAQIGRLLRLTAQKLSAWSADPVPATDQIPVGAV
jgi:IclR family KDG regulon transcriptional repressor